MLKLLMTSASAFALIMSAAAANPPEEAKKTPKYQPAEASASMAPIDVTTRKYEATYVDAGA